MHELYEVEQAALEGYATYNFPKGPSARSLFSSKVHP